MESDPLSLPDESVQFGSDQLPLLLVGKDAETDHLKTTIRIVAVLVLPLAALVVILNGLRGTIAAAKAASLGKLAERVSVNSH